MIVGIDTGGTNVDGVLLADEGDPEDGVLATAKVPGDEPAPVERVLDRMVEEPTDVERVVVATTIVLNAAVQDRLPACTSVLVPGPGLSPERAFHAEENHVAAGCIDPRGRVTEDPEYDGDPSEEVVAVTAKFGPRNPDPERDVRESIEREDERVALGSAAGPGHTFPQRAATTVANAKAGPTFARFASDVADALAAVGVEAPVYYLKGDGGMLSAEAMASGPAQALRGGGAASALGLVATTGVGDAVCIDVGGTTTDVTRVTDGFPATEPVEAGSLETGYEGVRTVDLPIGGDTRVVADGLTDRREGKAAAFGGDAPTLTDALYVVGAFDDAAGDDPVRDDAAGDDPVRNDAAGDEERARAAVEAIDDGDRVARDAVDSYVDRVTDAVDAVAPEATRLLVGGTLAPQLADRIGGQLARIDDVIVPERAPVAGAVGCAVARVSVETRIHVDSARGTMTVSSIGTRSEEVERGRRFDDAEVESLVRERARDAARDAGAVDADTAPVEVLTSRRFNVVEHARVAGQVVHATAQVEPGLRGYVGEKS